jgi:peptidoglycan hydrolase-like amidase
MLARLLAVLLLTLSFLIPSGNVEASHRSGHHERCTAWSSTTVPPNSIRVYRVSEGRVDTVNFRLYVQRVTSREWGKSQPYQLQRAGAVAVKQFAWYYVLNYRGGSYKGRCYDVKDSTADQLYSAKTPPPSSVSAVNSTWGITVWRDGRFIMTGYRTGHKRRCASDVTGYKLFARSARRCANAGWSAERILQVYYKAHLR